MKQFLNKKTFLLVAVAGVMAVSMTSCRKDFLDINNNPNAVTDINVTPELIFPAAASRTAAATASGNWTFLDNWMGYFSTAGDYAIDQEQTSYNLSTSFGTGIWTSHYDILFDLKQVQDKALAEHDSVLAGAAMILSVKLWQELVDVYGNIPYSQALQGANNTTPAYDRDSTVYRSLHQVLDQAISYMHGVAQPTYATVIGGIVKAGNGTSNITQTNWIHFANTLKLRLLIRTSEISTPNINKTAELAKITAEGGVLQAGESITFNPGYDNSTNKQSPFYANYGFTPTNTDGNAIARANKFIVDTMNTLSDARLARFFRGVGGTPTTQGGAVVGTRYGLATGNPFGNASSKMGFGTAGSATQNQWIFTSEESLFLYAEAVQRGWFTGSAAAAYNAAVTESFTRLGVPSAATAAAAYLVTQPYTGLTSIIWQKYLAMNSIDPLEAWCDYRRLHIPSTTTFASANPSRHAVGSSGLVLPNRLLYPQEEYSLNFSNVNAQGDINKDNVFSGSKIFWQP